jgi:hypothetical protein
MTEEEWLTADDPYLLLLFLRGEVEPPESEPDPRPKLCSHLGDLVFGDGRHISKRQLAQFCGLCSEKWRDLPLGQSSRSLIDLYEECLKGNVDWDAYFSEYRERAAFSEVAGWLLLDGFRAFAWHPNPFGAALLVQDIAWATASYHNRDRIAELERNATEDARIAWSFFGYDFPEFSADAHEVYRPLAAVLREIVGNPFRPVALDPRWLTSTVVDLARSIYEGDTRQAGGYLNLPILADALMDAGCDSEELLAHCRGDGPHVRGCWAVDLILGKE